MQIFDAFNFDQLIL